MISATVWSDAYARASAVAARMGVRLIDPLIQTIGDLPDAFWAFPVGAASSDRMGAGDAENEETGQILLVLMIPVGAMSTPDALTHCQAMSAAFRAPVGKPSTPPPNGLVYDGQDFDPPDLNETGNRYAMTLRVAYRFQSALLRQAE